MGMKNKKSEQESAADTAWTQAVAEVFKCYLAWLDAIIAARMKNYFEGEQNHELIQQLIFNMPFPEDDSPFEQKIEELALEPTEVILLLLAIAPHLRPQMLDIFFTKNPLYDRAFSEFGGHRQEGHLGFIPTGETAMFVLCADDLAARMAFCNTFHPQHRLYRLQLLQPAKTNDLSYVLALTGECLSLFLTGQQSGPEFGPGFPAKRLETKLEWEDLVLDSRVLGDLLEIRTWLEHGDELMDDWGLDRVLKPGFRSLFYGPPGTGKSLAAALVGKLTGRDVYRIDLSMVVSKYIGETEKNLASVFDFALEKDWILFFDEADALFGKRTTTSSSNDRYANQEVSYLLQRVEDFPGTVLLATNFKNNIDEAFMRRFQSVIHFQKPDPQQRLRLWKLAFSSKIPVANEVDLQDLARRFELTGGEIVNVLRHAALLAVARHGKTVLLDDILSGIRREFMKDGRMFESVMD